MNTKVREKKEKEKQAKEDKAREDEDKKILELRREMAEANQTEEGETPNDATMSWMYQPKSDLQENEDDLLLGKKKAQPKRFFVEEYFRIKEKEVPGALFIDMSKFNGPERDNLLQNLDASSKNRVNNFFAFLIINFSLGRSFSSYSECSITSCKKCIV